MSDNCKRDVTVREAVLTSAIEIVTKDRANVHGLPEDSFKNIASLWAIILGRAVTTMEVALCMDAVKTARLITTPTHKDSWIDKAGYAGCGAECAEAYEQLRYPTPPSAPFPTQDLTS